MPPPPYDLDKLKFTDWQITWYSNRNDTGKLVLPSLWNVMKIKVLNVCLQNKRIRFILLPVNIRYNDNKSHANYILIDKKHKTYELFEPNGWMYHVKNNKNLPFELQQVLKDDLIAYNFLYPNSICNYKGYQSVQAMAGTTHVDPSGYCVAWSMFYMDARLTYPNITPLKLRELFDIKFSNNSLKFRDFIRGYSDFLLRYFDTVSKNKDQIEIYITKLIQRFTTN